MVAEEALYSTSISLESVDRSSSYSVAALRAACGAALLEDDNDDGNSSGCYLDAVCSPVRQLGLLRPVIAGGTMLNVIGPESPADGHVGLLLLLRWSEAVVEAIPADSGGGAEPCSRGGSE